MPSAAEKVISWKGEKVRKNGDERGLYIPEQDKCIKKQKKPSLFLPLSCGGLSLSQRECSSRTLTLFPSLFLVHPRLIHFVVF
jgi:hypothetical protein